MELVISGIYWIFCRFLNAIKVAEDEEDIPVSCKIFCGKYGEQCITQALEILELNLQRVSDSAEDSEKYILSMSVLQFLKDVSVSPLAKSLKRKSESLRKLLKLEELYSSNKINYLPIDLENTQLGTDTEILMDCITNIKNQAEKEETEAEQPVSIYCDVSYRILARICDVLMNINVYDSIEVQDASKAEEVLFESMKIYYSKKKKAEKSFVKDVPERWISSLKRSEYNNLKIQHQRMRDMNAIEILLRLFIGP